MRAEEDGKICMANNKTRMETPREKFIVCEKRCKFVNINGWGQNRDKVSRFIPPSHPCVSFLCLRFEKERDGNVGVVKEW